MIKILIAINATKLVYDPELQDDFAPIIYLAPRMPSMVSAVLSITCMSIRVFRFFM